MIQRRYLFPCTGYVSSMEPHVAPPTAMVEGSFDWLLSPNEGQLVARRGNTIVPSSNTAGTSEASANPVLAPIGALEARAGYTSGSTNPRTSSTSFGGMFGRHMFQLESPALTGARPTFGCLLADEHDQRQMGTIAWYDKNDTSMHQLGFEYAAGAGGSNYIYPTDASQSAKWKYKVMPLPYTTAIEATPGLTTTSRATGYNRGTFAFQRLFFSGGGRRAVQVGDWVYGTSFYGTPLRWNRIWNAAGTSSATNSKTNQNRIMPWGIIPPLYPPTVAAGTSTTTDSEANWREGDAFYVSVLFEMEDGSYSMPVFPRAVNAVLTSGYGLVTLGAAPTTGTTLYKSVTWSNIPIGPNGTRARILLRTPHVNISTGYAGGDTGINAQDISFTFGVVVRIDDNVSTSYIDPAGNDASLVIDTDSKIVRFDHIWPPSCRYAWHFDQRIAVGHTRYQPCAVILARTGVNANYDLNSADDAANTYPASAAVYRIHEVAGSSTTLQLYAYSYAGTYGTPTSITLNSSTTLQTVIDTINATAFGGNGNAWRAQMVPGVDPNVASSNLAPTLVEVAVTDVAVASSTVTCSTSGQFANVAIGMRVANKTGATLGSATCVIRKPTANTVVLGNDAGVEQTITTSTATLYFYSDTGDNATQSGSAVPYGLVRTWNQTFPGILAFSGTYLDTLPLDDQYVYFTVGSPNTASSATAQFVLPNRRDVDASAGPLVGGAPLNNGCVVLYANAVYTLENRRGGTTGEDQDYRLYPLNTKRGCISPDSIVSGDGWVGYMTAEGYAVTDGKVERMISKDVYDPSTGKGDWDAAIQAARDATQNTRDGAQIHAMTADNKLHITYPTSSTGLPTRRLVYDYSRGVESSGLNAVLKDIGGTESTASAYGWSAPLRNSVFGPMCGVVESDGLALYGWSDNFNFNVASAADDGTYDGRCYEIGNPTPDTQNADNDITTQAWAYDELKTHVGGLQATSGQATANGGQGVAVGAEILNADYTGDGDEVVADGSYVSAKNTSAGTITLSTTAGTDSTGGYGFEMDVDRVVVEPVALFSQDLVDSLVSLKSTQRAAVLYSSGVGGVMKLLHSSALGPPQSTSYSLDGSASPRRAVVELSQVDRSPGTVVQFGVSHATGFSASSTLPQFWGVSEADVNVLTTLFAS